MGNTGPSRINFVSFLVLLAVLAAGYWCWKFMPHYYTAWQVDHVLAEAGNRSYKFVRLGDPARGQGLQEIEDSSRKSIIRLGVTDPEMQMHLDVSTPEIAIAECKYSVVIDHPYVNKQTVLVMDRIQKIDISKVAW